MYNSCSSLVRVTPITRTYYNYLLAKLLINLFIFTLIFVYKYNSNVHQFIDLHLPYLPLQRSSLTCGSVARALSVCVVQIAISVVVIACVCHATIGSSSMRFRSLNGVRLVDEQGV